MYRHFISEGANRCRQGCLSTQLDQNKINTKRRDEACDAGGAATG